MLNNCDVTSCDTGDYYSVVIDYFTDCKFSFDLRKSVQFHQSHVRSIIPLRKGPLITD